MIPTTYDPAKDLLSVQRCMLLPSDQRTPLSPSLFVTHRRGSLVGVTFNRPRKWGEATVRKVCSELFEVPGEQIALAPDLFTRPRGSWRSMAWFVGGMASVVALEWLVLFVVTM